MKMSHYGTYWVSFFKGVILVLLILALTGCSIGGEKKIKIFSVEKPRDKVEQKARLKSLLEELDLTSLAKSKAYTLSGGEKRRLEITRALVTSPRMLLLDEPFSGIDPIAVYEVQKILKSLTERRMGILITDHNVRETLKLVDRAYIIHKGDVRCEGEAEHLVNDPTARDIYLGPEFNL